uniref:Peptidase M12B domain-containing protein n=1 Tax=Macrostomum lignano TaxID=282301 RepID=A0A1I8IVP5_9PLAT
PRPLTDINRPFLKPQARVAIRNGRSEDACTSSLLSWTVPTPASSAPEGPIAGQDNSSSHRTAGAQPDEAGEDAVFSGRRPNRQQVALNRFLRGIGWKNRRVEDKPTLVLQLSAPGGQYRCPFNCLLNLVETLLGTNSCCTGVQVDLALVFLQHLTFLPATGGKCLTRVTSNVLSVLNDNNRKLWEAGPRFSVASADDPHIASIVDEGGGEDAEAAEAAAAVEAKGGAAGRLDTEDGAGAGESGSGDQLWSSRGGELAKSNISKILKAEQKFKIGQKKLIVAVTTALTHRVCILVDGVSPTAAAHLRWIPKAVLAALGLWRRTPGAVAGVAVAGSVMLHSKVPEAAIGADLAAQLYRHVSSPQNARVFAEWADLGDANEAQQVPTGVALRWHSDPETSRAATTAAIRAAKAHKHAHLNKKMNRHREGSCGAKSAQMVEVMKALVLLLLVLQQLQSALCVEVDHGSAQSGEPPVLYFHQLNHSACDGEMLAVVNIEGQEGRRVSLKLTESSREFLAADAPADSQFVLDGLGSRPCFYQGQLVEGGTPVVAKLSRDGLFSATFDYNGTVYEVRPQSKRLAVFLGNRLPKLGGTERRCPLAAKSAVTAAAERPIRSRQSALLMDTRSGVAQPSQKFIQLVLVSDEAYFIGMGRDSARTQDRLWEIGNYINSLYKQLGVNVVIVRAIVLTTDPFTLANKTSAVSSSEMLDKFMAYRMQNLSHIQHSAAHLVSGLRMTGSDVGLAHLGKLCQFAYGGGVNSDLDIAGSAINVAVTVAHELGHNLGMNHDEDDVPCSCPDPQGCIMKA